MRVFPKIIDHTPLGKIPGLADAVKLGENGKTFIDPTSWVSRGAEAAYRGYKFVESAEMATARRAVRVRVRRLLLASHGAVNSGPRKGRSGMFGLLDWHVLAYGAGRTTWPKWAPHVVRKQGKP